MHPPVPVRPQKWGLPADPQLHRKQGAALTRFRVARGSRKAHSGDHPAGPARLVLRTSPAPDPASSSTTADPTSHGSLLRRSPPPPRPGPTPLDAPARLIPEPDPNPSPTENQPNLPIHRSDLRTRKPPRCVRLQPPTARQHHPAPSARPPGFGARLRGMDDHATPVCTVPAGADCTTIACRSGAPPARSQGRHRSAGRARRTRMLA